MIDNLRRRYEFMLSDGYYLSPEELYFYENTINASELSNELLEFLEKSRDKIKADLEENVRVIISAEEDRKRAQQKATEAEQSLSESKILESKLQASLAESESLRTQLTRTNEQIAEELDVQKRYALQTQEAERAFKGSRMVVFLTYGLLGTLIVMYGLWQNAEVLRIIENLAILTLSGTFDIIKKFAGTKGKPDIAEPNSSRRLSVK